MRLTVIYPDSRVVKDGESYVVDLPQADIHAIQWHDDQGEIERADGNEAFDDAAVIQPYLDLWQAAYDAANPPPKPPSLDDRKAEKRAKVIALFDAKFAMGFSPAGTMQGETLQVATLIDRTNWLTSLGAYQVAIASGAADVEGATFRTTANKNYRLTFNEGLQVLMAMIQWGQAMYANLWALKDALDAAPDDKTLDEINIRLGWPS